VTPTSVRLVGGRSLALAGLWAPPAGQRITLATLNPSQILVTTGSGRLVYLQVEEGHLVERRCARPRSAPHTVCGSMRMLASMRVCQYACLWLWLCMCMCICWVCLGGLITYEGRRRPAASHCRTRLRAWTPTSSSPVT
jgi:hypothetical protein